MSLKLKLIRQAIKHVSIFQNAQANEQIKHFKPLKIAITR